MKRNIIISVVVVTLVIFLAIVGLVLYNNYSYSKNVKELVKDCENNNAAEAMGLYYNSFSDKDKDDLVRLINNNSEKIPPLFIILSAEHIYKTDKDKAVLYYYIGKLRTKEDVYMCEDKTSRQQMFIYPNLARNTVIYSDLRISKNHDKKFLADVLQKALDWDISHPKRYNAIWACYHGVTALYSEPKLVNADLQKKIIEDERKSVKEAIEQLRK